MYSQYFISGRRLLTPLAAKGRNLVQSPLNLYDYEFLKVASSYTDLMSDDLFDKIHDIIASKIMHLETLNKDDTVDELQCLQIISNMIEYLDYDITTNNFTGSWLDENNQTSPEKINRVK